MRHLIKSRWLQLTTYHGRCEVGTLAGKDFASSYTWCQALGNFTPCSLAGCLCLLPISDIDVTTCGFGLWEEVIRFAVMPKPSLMPTITLLCCLARLRPQDTAAITKDSFSLMPCWYPSLVVHASLLSFREGEKHYISSSHLGLIRCPTPIGVGVIIYAQTICDKLGNPM